MRLIALCICLLLSAPASAYYDGPVPPATPAPPGYVWAYWPPIKGYAFVPTDVVQPSPPTSVPSPQPACPNGRCPLQPRR